MLEDIIQQIKQYQKNGGNVDAIVMTGDYIQFEPDAIHGFVKRFLRHLLREISPRFGAFAVIGNHDHKKKGAKHIVMKSLKSLDGVAVLENSMRVAKANCYIPECNIGIRFSF